MPSSRKAAALTRRQFVAVGALGSAAVAIGCDGCSKGDWDFFTEQQARTLTAICDQIVPADGFPSASQAGVLTFIDRQLARPLRRFRKAYRDGLERAEALSRNRFGRELAALSPSEQFEIVKATEQQDREFFELVRNHTLDGYYGAPRHGGNRDAVSWRMLGLAEPPPNGRAQYSLRKDSSS
jgi:gluconate 2-dehydrogenase gamma chain